MKHVPEFLPSELVDDYMADLGEFELKLVLLIIRHYRLRVEFDCEDLSKTLKTDRETVKDAIRVLCEKQLVRIVETPDGVFAEFGYDETDPRPPYSFEECTEMRPVLTAEQESLPWESWRWDDRSGLFRRQCVVPPEKSRCATGMHFGANVFFSTGVLIIYQDALRVKERRPRSLANITKLVTERLGYTPERWQCTYCLMDGTPTIGPDGRSWHADHSYPHVLGGDTKADNMVLACATCNLKKNKKTAAEFVGSAPRG